MAFWSLDVTVNVYVALEKLAALQAMMPAATEARRLYRKIRRNLSSIQLQLRHVKKNFGGHLVLSETLEEELEGPVGLI
jgi:hypothetical protein